MFFVTNYADFKLIAAQFTGGKLFHWQPAGQFKAWGMASGFPVLVLSLATKPPLYDTDFPGSVALSSGIATEIG